METVFGGRSMQLARVFGVRIGVDASWFLVLFLIVWSLSGTYGEIFPGEDTKVFLLAAVSGLLFFLSVVLHELGHAFVATRNGIGVVGIDLWLFGGIAKMRRDSDSAAVEFRIAIAGPLVTLAIAAGCVAAGALLLGGEEFQRAMLLEGTASVAPLGVVLGYLALINTMLLIFNLIPAFPLDGGRIARAIAWWRTGDRARATRFAASLGGVLSYVFAAIGLLWVVNGNPIEGLWLVFIGLFVGRAARSAELQTSITARIEGIRVSDVMDSEPVAVPAEAKLDRALNEFFLRYRWPWFPVTDGTGRLLGLVSRQKVDEVPEALRPSWTVDAVMTADPPASVRVRVDEPLEALLGYEGLHRLGAIMAVDGDGVLRGVVTLGQLHRALRRSAPVT